MKKSVYVKKKMNYKVIRMIRIKSIIFDFFIVSLGSISAYASFYSFEIDAMFGSLSTLAYFYVLFWFLFLIFELLLFKNSTLGQRYYGLCYVVENYRGISYLGKDIITRRLIYTTILSAQLIGFVYLDEILILLSLIIMVSPSGKNENGIMILLIDLITGLKVDKSNIAEIHT